MRTRRTTPLSIRKQRHFRRFRFLLSSLVLLGVAWGAGLLWYVNLIPDQVQDPDRKTDAIVVLTGGSERLAEGRKLLSHHLAKKLFISGVYRGVEVDELLNANQADPRLVSCCIVLGHTAENTRGNALETAAWMAKEGYHSLRIVTANYHMPRSLLEFKSLMPDVEIISHPVFPGNVKVHDWWRWPGSASLIASEYNKYLFAALRNKLVEWLPHSQNVAPPGIQPEKDTDQPDPELSALGKQSRTIGPNG